MKLLFRIIRRLLLGIVLLVIVVVAGMFIIEPVMTYRLFTQNLGPEEVVGGGPLIVIPTADPEQRSISDEALQAAIEFGQDNGSHALIVYHNGSIQLEQYYSGFDANSITPTQSMHKSVLAMLVGIAIEQGYITSVDESAATYLTEWADDGRADITIRQMLQQDSGIKFPTFGPNIFGGFFQLVLGDDIEPVALNQPLEFEPGFQFDYNSVNPQNLGLLIQRATGKRYADYLSEALWRHIGVPDASVVLDSEEHRMARMFCCLNATARAWLHVGLLHLSDGRLGDTQVVPTQWMRQIRTPGAHNPNYGYLTWLGTEFEGYRYYNRKTPVRVFQSEPFAAPDLTYFDGFAGQRVYSIPSQGLVIVRVGDLTPDMDESYLPNLIIRGIRR